MLIQWIRDIFQGTIWPSINNRKLKLMKGKALRKHSLHEKTAASVLLKLFIPVYDKPYHMNNGFQHIWAEIKFL